ncbi:MAG: hypothetical protein E4G97_00870 [Deltaproteobacteria bacterium]|nr:MAG: hypothetical protein E4G97_00870 [Deltaproteobacteria bacterium]
MGAAINLATLAYTEVDPNSRIARSTVTATGTGLKRDESAYVYYDWGADHFGDFTQLFDYSLTTIATGSKGIIWGLSNTVDSQDGWAAGLYLKVDGINTSTMTITLGEVGGSTDATATIGKNAAYFIRVRRVGDALTATLYSSAANQITETVYGTLAITVATTAYRYHYVMSTISEADTTTITFLTRNWMGSGMTSAGTPFYSALATGSSGDWNSGASWGNAGTTKGTDYPGNVADVFRISTGFTMEYNVSEANALGDGSDIYGTLNFKKDANTLLTLGHATLIIRAGGTLAIGTDANPIGAAYTAQLLWATTSDASKGLTTIAGSTFSVVGSQMHGGIYRSYLVAEWSSGQVFTVNGDVRTEWPAGRTVLAHKFPASFGSQAYGEYTIASTALNGANTDITINEAAPGVTFRTGGFVYLTTRNVTIGKSGAARTLTSYNTARPTLNYGNGTNTFKEAEAIGFYYFGGALVQNPMVTMTGAIFRNSYSMFSHYGARYFVTDCLITMISGNTMDLVSGGSLFTRCHFVCQGASGSHGGVYDSRFDDCVWSGFPLSTGGLLASSCRFFACEIVDTRRFISENIKGYFYNCLFGKHAHEGTNTSGALTDMPVVAGTGLTQVVFSNCWFSTEDGSGDFPTVSSAQQQTGASNADLMSTDHNQVAGDTRRWRNVWKYKSEVTVVRAGGAATSIMMHGLEYNSKQSLGTPVFEWTEFAVPASSQVRSIYIRGGGFGATFPTAAEAWLEAEYYDAAGTPHRTLLKSTEVISDNTTWTKLSCTFTPGQEASVTYRFFLAFEAGLGTTSTFIYIDPVLNDA